MYSALQVAQIGSACYLSLALSFELQPSAQQSITNSQIQNLVVLFPATTVHLTQLHIGKFPKKLIKNDHIFYFSTVTFFVLKKNKLFVSTDRNVVFPQILIDIPLLYDQWLPRYVNGPHANCRDYMWGGCRLENGGNPPKTNFNQVLDR